MKRIANLDDRLIPINAEDSHTNLPTVRDILRLIGNIKAENADDARRSLRLINVMRVKTEASLTLENDDISFLTKTFERNAMNLTSWIQGQILDVLDNADKVDPTLKAV